MALTNSDYQYILFSYNFTGSPASTLPIPNQGITSPAPGNPWDISFAFLENRTDLTNTGAYDGSTGQNQFFAPLTQEQMDIAKNILELRIGATTFGFADSVTFSDVANIKFTLTDPSVAAITMGQEYDKLTSSTGTSLNPDFPTMDAAGNPIDPDREAAYTLPYRSVADPTLSEKRASDIWLNADARAGWNVTSPGSGQYETIMHELGHALGLQHTFVDETKAPRITANGLNIDSQQYSIMSYQPLAGMALYDANGLITNGVAPKGLQILDIAGIQAIYGYNHRGEYGIGGVLQDTLYSKDTVFASTAQNGAFIYTIWDGGGTDTISAAGYDVPSLIDLRQGEFSSIGHTVDPNFNASDPILGGNLFSFTDPFGYQAGQAKYNVAIAFHTVIENAVGTDGNDLLIGNGWSNNLTGGKGNDILYGDGFVFDGSAGFEDPVSTDPNARNYDPDDPNLHVPSVSGDNDIFDPGIGVDEAYGGYGDDKFIAAGAADGSGLQGDLYDGGGEISGGTIGLFHSRIPTNLDGFDTVDYSHLNSGYGIQFTYTDALNESVIAWNRGSGVFGGTADQLVSIEKIVGTQYDDDFKLSGPAGLTLDGSGGTNTVTYTASTGLVFDAAHNTVYDSKGQHDTILNANAVVQNVYQNTILPDLTQSGSVWQFYHTIDYSQSTAQLDFEWQVNNGIVSNYIDIGNVRQTLDAFYYVGTNNGDNYYLEGNFSYSHGGTFITGTGTDTVHLFESAGQSTTFAYTGGNDTWFISDSLKEIDMIGLSVDDVQITSMGPIVNANAAVFDAVLTINSSTNGAFGTQTLTLHYDGSYPFVVPIKFADGEIDFARTQQTGAMLTATTTHAQFPAPITPYFSWGADLWASPTHFSGDGGTLYALGGDDNLTVNSGKYIIHGGTGNDTITSNSQTGANALFGDEGDDVLTGAGGHATLDGGAGSDTLTSTAGVNLLQGGLDNDLYNIGKNAISTITDVDGLNTAHFTDSNLSDYTLVANGASLSFMDSSKNTVLTITDTGAFGDVSFANGQHVAASDLYALAVENPAVLYYTVSSGNDTVFAFYGADHVLIDLGAGNDSFYAAVNSAPVTVYAGSGDDFVIAWAGNDHIYGEDGNDYNLDGGAGNDIIDGGDGSDTVAFGSYAALTTGVVVNLTTGIVSEDGTGGHDTLISIENVRGGELGDTITGTDGVNQLEGNGGNDTIYGLGGDDYLDGGRGDNTLDGGAGTDIYYVGVSNGNGMTVNLTTGTATNIYGGHDTLVSIENIDGGYDGHNDITGSDVANYIAIYGGNNIVRGMGGDDLISLQSQTGQGSNVIDGGTGNDTMSGTHGNDTYLFRTGDGQDSVTDTDGTNTLQFQGITDQHSFTYNQTGNDLVIGYGANDAVTVKGYFSNADTISQILLDGGQTYSLSSLLAAYTADHAPVAQDDSFISIRNQVLTGNVIANNGNGADSDPDGDALHVVAQTVTTAAGGTVVFLSSGDFTYTPADGFMGIDTFSYTLKDFYGKPDVGQVSVEVVPPLPVARPDDFTVAYNQTLSGNVLADNGHGADFDPQGGTLQVIAGTFATVHGSVTIATDGSFSYTAHNGYVGGDTFNYTLENSYGGISTGTASLSIGAPAGAIVGTNNNDTLFGTAGNDTFYGLRGADSLNGGAGNDTYVVSTGWGADTINETNTGGFDTIRITELSSSQVRLFTDSQGNLHIVSTLDPNDNITVLAGTTGNNVSESKIGQYMEQIVFDDATIDLTAGLNITGSTGGETLYGTAFNDSINGDAGNDTIFGNAGNDTITGGAGADNLIGGSGDDTYVFAAGWGADTINEVKTTGGFDTIRITGLTADDIRMFTDSQGNLHIVNNLDANDTITVLAGTTGANVSESTIGQYMERIVFDDGTVIDLTGSLIIEGSSSGETLYGTAFADTIYGYGGNDTIFANGSGDTVNGGAGADNLNGGAGDDTYVFTPSWGADTINDPLNSGNDTIRITDLTPAQVRLFTDSQGNLHIVNKLDGNDTITVLAGTTGNNVSESKIGLYMEQIVFDDGTTISLTGGLNIEGSASGETLYGTQYNDTILGQAGNDTIFGNAGNDTITGGTGADNLQGGSGDDTYIYNVGWGADTINEVKTTGGFDTIQINGLTPDEVRLFTDSQGNLHIVNKLDANDSITVLAGTTGVNVSESTIGQYVERIVFDNGDVIDLTGALTIEGSPSGETLYGTAFSDTIYGYGGNDTIFANGSGDTVDGGAGADNLQGGAGDDTYVFAPGWGADTVNDPLNSGNDTIRITGLTPADIRLFTDSQGNLHIVNKLDSTDNITVLAGTTGNNVSESKIGLYMEQIVFDDGTTINLTGGLTIEGSTSGETLYGTAFADQILGQAGNDTIFGNAGNDTIISGTGADNLQGGAGADKYIFVHGDGADFISDPSGNNILSFEGGLTQADVIYTRVSNNLVITYGSNGSDNVTISNFYTEDPNLVTFVFQFSDGSTFNPQTFLPDHNPVALPDDFTGTMNQVVTGNVLANNGHGADYDIDQDTLSVVPDFLNTAHGQVILNADGSFTYLGAANFIGTDSFTYTLLDGRNGSATATVTLNITHGTNTAPVAQDDDFSGYKNQPISGNVLANNGHGVDYDPDGDSLTVTAGTFATAHGSVTLNANGTFTYTPTTGYNGADSFQYTLLDGFGGQTQGTVNLTLLDHAPVALGDNFAVDQNQVLNGNVLANNGAGADYDPDGDALTVTAGTFTTTNGGQVVLNADGSFNYTPLGTFSGLDSFNYTLSDGTLQASATVGITVMQVSTNHNPIAEPDSFGVVQGQTLSGNVLANNGSGVDFDPDNDPLSITVGTVSTAHGSVSLNADGTFVYTPTAGYFGLDSFNYTLLDGQGGQATGTASISVDGLPVAKADTFHAQENHPFTGNVLADNGQGVDSDPDGDALSVTAGTFATTHGSVTINTDGSFTYTAVANYFGADSFNYTISDGRGGTATATASLAINGTPVAHADAFNAIMGQGVTGNVLSNNGSGADSDPDGGTLSIVAGTYATLHGGTVVIGANGSFSYTPGGLVGLDYFSYTLLDGQGGQATGGVTITNAFPTGTITGTSHADNITGTSGDDVIFGLGGGDTINGIGGNDILHGGDGKDVITGGVGNDLLYGAAGGDTLTGGGGADIFMFQFGDGNKDIVTDFNAAEGDKIDFSLLIQNPDPAQNAINTFIHSKVQGSDTILTVDTNGATGGSHFTNIVVLQGVTNFDIATAVANGTLIA